MRLSFFYNRAKIENMIIGQIDGRDATPKDFRELFNNNSWEESAMDYAHSDDFWPLEEPIRSTDINMDDYDDYSDGLNDSYSAVSINGELYYRKKIKDFSRTAQPAAGTPVTGYRVFTYIEGDANVLGSPVAGYQYKVDTMFGVPQRRDDVNKHTIPGKGFYYFLNKETAVAYVAHLLQMDEDQKPDYTESPLHVIVSRVEGSYIDKYRRDQDTGQYGEEMDKMKLVDTPILDINITKLQEAFWQTAHLHTWGSGRTTWEGDRVFESWKRDSGYYNSVFDKMKKGPWDMRFYEKHPAAFINAYELWRYNRDELSLGHYDVSKYEDIWSKDEQKRRQARMHLYNDYQELRQLFPDRHLPNKEPPV